MKESKYRQEFIEILIQESKEIKNILGAIVTKSISK